LTHVLEMIIYLDCFTPCLSADSFFKSNPVMSGGL
jgi:hypothetical protein